MRKETRVLARCLPWARGSVAALERWKQPTSALEADAQPPSKAQCSNALDGRQSWGPFGFHMEQESWRAPPGFSACHVARSCNRPKRKLATSRSRRTLYEQETSKVLHRALADASHPSDFSKSTRHQREQAGAGAQGAPLRAQEPATPAAGLPPRPSQRAIGDFAPKLAELTDDVLYGDIWERPELSKRDRSLVTVAALIAMNRPEQLRSQLVKARDNGVKQEELIETITHLAFYAGWPNAVTAIGVAREVFDKK